MMSGQSTISAFKTLDTCLPVFRYIEEHQTEFLEDVVRICEVAAPTFHEENRAHFLHLKFQELGLLSKIDPAGNVIVPFCRKGKPHVVLSAHLDTVFPFEKVHVLRDGPVLRAPGIADDSAGLAALLLLSRAFQQCVLADRGSLTLLATVGEEGLGNLRGVRHFFSAEKDVDYFISLDGCDAQRLITAGLASKRLRVFFRGPGGHSWGDAGTPNPIHIAGKLLSKINKLSIPKKPKTTINVGIISGGTSINAIPTEVFLDVDLRSETAESLAWLDESLQQILQETAQAEAAIRQEVILLGERPSGSLAVEHPLLKTTAAANQQFGLSANVEAGSTDSNVPFALGIPAITTGIGGVSGKIHTPDEWFDTTDVETGLKRTALLVAELLNS